MPALGNTAGMAHQAFGLCIAVHADQQTPTHCRRGLAELAVALGQIIVDMGGGGLHRQLAQGHEVGLGKKCIDGRTRLLRHIHLAVTQALQQLAGWQVDQQQFVSLLQHPVRQGFAHLHASDAAHLVIEAFQVLDVDRGEHVDAGGEQFLDVLPALFMTAAGSIAVGQFVHQHQLGCGCQQPVEVHLFELHAAILRAQHGLLRQPVEQCFGLGPTMGLDHPRQHRYALADLGMSRLQHGVGLAHAGRCAKKHLEPATACAR